MTRRAFLPLAAVGALGNPPEAPVVVPVHRLINCRAKLRPRYLRKFSSVIWPETLRDFRKCGIGSLSVLYLQGCDCLLSRAAISRDYINRAASWKFHVGGQCYGSRRIQPDLRELDRCSRRDEAFGTQISLTAVTSFSESSCPPRR